VKSKNCDENCEDIHIGDIAVRTGRVVIADPTWIGEVMQQKTDRVNADPTQPGVDTQGYAHRSAAEVFNARKDSSSESNIGIGVVLPTGSFDGTYPVIAHYITDSLGRRIGNVSILFENPRSGGACEREPHRASERCMFGSLTHKEDRWHARKHEEAKK
jgi:hypothetical protein